MKFMEWQLHIFLLLTLLRIHISAVYTCKYVRKEKAMGFITVKRLFKSGNSELWPDI